MKYENFIEHIQDVLQNPEYGFKLKIYDENGNISLDGQNIKWIFIVNNNILIELMDKNSNVLNIWKDIGNNKSYITDIIKDFRKEANLNGINLKITNFNSLSREKIFELIKKNMSILKNRKNEKKEEDMNIEINESKIAKTYYAIMNSIKTARKPSDAVITEGQKISRIISLLNETNNEISSLKVFENKDIKSFNSGIFLCKTLNEMIDYISKYSDKNIVKLIGENINLFKKVGKFVKNRYEKCILNPIINENALKFYENIKLYKNTITDIDNLASAYNELKPLIKEAKCSSDIIRILKQTKICETYNVKRRTLLNYWIENSSDANPVSSRTYIKYVAENIEGKMIELPNTSILGIRLITENLNNGGSITDECITKIIKECEVNTNLKNFINTYKEKNEYTKIAKALFLESSILLRKKLNEFIIEYRERKPSEKFVKLLEGKLKTNDPSLYYISEELQNYENQDIEVLEEGLKPFVSKKELNPIVQNIINNKLDFGNQINESNENATSKELLTKLYTKLCENLNDKTNLAVSSSVFYLLHKPIELNEKQIKYIDCLLKYQR